MELFKNKIIVIIPYFGNWPSYFDLFLKGCENNHWLDILFFTDCKIPTTNTLKNIRYIHYTLEDFSKLASKKIGENFDIKVSYKLCDFRPCYGLIFEDFITGYDYWGYGDIDLIYGDLSGFILPKIEESYDIISNRKEIMSGSLALFKNRVDVNLLFKKLENLVPLLKTDGHEALDETAHVHTTWKGASKLTLPIHCFTYLIANEEKDKNLKVSFESNCKEFIGNNDIVKFDCNRLTFNNHAIGYYHYVCNKNNEQFKFPSWKEIPSIFYVTETGFYHHSPNQLIHLKRKIVGFSQNITTRILKRLKIWN